MKKTLTVMALLVAGLTAASATAETRNVGSFTALDARGRYTVEVTIGAQTAVQVDGPDASRVAARVRGDELTLTPIDRNWFGEEPQLNAVVRVTTPTLTSVQSSRGTFVRVRNLSAGDLNLDASMGAILSAYGSCGRLEASASMGGSLEADGLSCGSVRVNASMGGTVKVIARDAVEASASMGGTVNVTGAPARREASSSMGGSISFN